MSDDIKKDRSPRYPKYTLEEALNLARTLHSKAGKAKVRREVAVGALGYSGLNGASLGTLGALNQYGLIDIDRGEGVAISPLAVKLIHPFSAEQGAQSKLESALRPRVFSDIFTGGYHDCSEDVLANHLIQSNFTPEGAKKAASIYKENAVFVNLQSSSNISASREDENSSRVPESHEMPSHTSPPVAPSARQNQPLFSPGLSDLIASPKKKEYRTDLGSLTAFITIMGDSEPTPDDFEALSEFALFQKSQAERKLGVNKESKKTPATDEIK